MLVLVGVAFVAGLVTALSPCVLPVLPIVLAGGASGRKPLAIVAGIVGSFTVFTLGAAWLLDLLNLPDDLLRNLAIALLALVAATLLVPPLGERLSRALARLGRRPAGELGGGVLLGAALGLVFVPCAGPVLAAITVLAANGNVGLDGVLLTLSYAAGAALPLLAVAFAGRSAANRLRAHARPVRFVSGGLIAAAAVAIALGVDQRLQTRVPGYTEVVQNTVEKRQSVARQLAELTGARAPEAAAALRSSPTDLPDYGPAPELAKITAWLNSVPLGLAALRGRVVLLDFWTYSCINCLRTLPHIKRWDDRYRDSGLVILGVHTPEFAFERELDNVRENVSRLGLRYPIALDNEFGTWNAWRNQYWPAKYLIDRSGRVRYYHFGEGEYEETEDAVRRLLAERVTRLPPPTSAPDRTPLGVRTPESYLGYGRLARFRGPPVRADVEADYRFPPQLAQDELAYGGRWRVENERIVAGAGARLRIRYYASQVFLVLGGRGTVHVLVDGKPERTVRISGDRLYTLVERLRTNRHLLELRFDRGVEAYALTFG